MSNSAPNKLYFSPHLLWPTFQAGRLCSSFVIFFLLRRPVGRVPWDAVLKGKVQEGWCLFKKMVLEVQTGLSPCAGR